MMQIANAARMKVADEVWIATALLHKERPSAEDFSTEEILDRATKEGIQKPLRPGVYVHIVQHCVANRPPNPGRYRMLFETVDGRRRLYRSGDPYHPDRSGAKTTPERSELPPRYEELLQWYEAWSREQAERHQDEDPLLKIRGTGAHLWKDEPADEYVERLREGWQ